MRRPRSALLLILAAAGSLDAGAQEAGPRGWSLHPSAEVNAVWDDNLFFRGSQTGRSAFFTRFGGGISTAHNGVRTTFTGGYRFTGEQFTGEFEPRSEVPASQRASIGLSTRMGSASSLSVAGSYIVSRNPNQVFDPVGIEFGRRRAEGYSASVAFNRRLSARHNWSAQYEYGFRELDARPEESELQLDSRAHSFSTGWSHQISTRSGGSLNYLYRVFRDQRRTSRFGLDEPLQSHVAFYSWSYQLGPRTAFAAHGGPNFYEDLILEVDSGIAVKAGWKITPHLGASLSHAWNHVTFSVGYTRAQNQFVGAGGRVTSNNLSVSLGVKPAQRLSFNTSVGASRNELSGETFETYRAGAGMSLQLKPWWSMQVQYNYVHQERYFRFFGEDIDLDPGARSRNQAFIGMVMGKSFPLQ